MFKVYWTYMADVPMSQTFEDTELTKALAFTEALRADRRDGAPYTFITMVSENPDSVGQAGVGETGPEYKHQWYKRREAPV